MNTRCSRKTIAAATALAMTFAALAGCSSSTDPTAPGQHSLPAAGAVAIVLGAHANVPAPTTTGPVAAALQAADAGRGDITLVVDGGQPEIVGTFAYPDCNNPTACSGELRTRGLAVQNTVLSTKARSAEVDLLGAIAVADRAIQHHPGNKLLLVSDSGLSTVDPLAFQAPGLLMADPQDITEYLQQHHAIPDLSGVGVALSLCNTAPPQEPLSAAACSNITEIWALIAKAGHARSVTVLNAPAGGPAVSKALSVTTVSMPAPPPPPVISTAQPPSTAAAVPPSTPRSNTRPPKSTRPSTPRPRPTTEDPPGHRIATLTNNQLRFVPDGSAFVDPAAARGILTPIAQYILNNRLKVSLIGTTSSWGTEQGRHETSVQRADAVKVMLVELGVPAKKIATDGVGCDWPGYTPDRDAHGDLLPIPAARNRTVIVEARQA